MKIKSKSVSNSDNKKSISYMGTIKDELKLLKERKLNIEKYGWDCVDYPRKPWQDGKVFSVAVTGKSGTGSSTFVNSFLNLEGKNKAKVGLTETTDVIDRETFEPHRQSIQAKGGLLSNSKVMDVFDLPSYGTDKFPFATYIQNFGLRHFDMVIIMVAERIMKDDTSMQTELEKFNIPCFVVRNKVDMAVEINKFDNDMSEEETLKLIRADFFAKGMPYFLISARNRT